LPSERAPSVRLVAKRTPSNSDMTNARDLMINPKADCPCFGIELPMGMACPACGDTANHWKDLPANAWIKSAPTPPPQSRHQLPLPITYVVLRNGRPHSRLCNACGGAENRLGCLFCHGTGLAKPCETCGGEGFVSTGRRCPICNGTGFPRFPAP
jgi:hypothetical protein